MESLKTFFTVLTYESTEHTIHAAIQINSSHPLFNGHFPNYPVVPGVLWMYIGKKLAEKIVGKNIRTTSSSEIRFLTLANPRTVGEIIFDIRLESNKMNCSVSAKERLARFSCHFEAE